MTTATPTEHNALAQSAKQLGLPMLPADWCDGELPAAIPGLSEAFLTRNSLFPLGFDGAAMKVAVCPPLPVAALEALKQFSGQRHLQLWITTDDAIQTAIRRLSSIGNSAMNLATNANGDAENADEDDLELLKHQAEDAPVVRLAQYLIQTAVEQNASDIHLEIYQDVFKVRLRLDGVLHDLESPPRRLFLPTLSHLKLRARMNIAERRLPQDGRIKMKMRDHDVDMRVSTLPTVYGESMVIRLLDRGQRKLSLAGLGFEPAVLETFRHHLNQPHGMILLTGPTGSGKTTTLYGALSEINRSDVKIITVEDPVEYQITGINQVQVKPQIDLNFANALRAIVRQDPDIIMIGEIRDGETADIAIQAALTGHLVLSTLHTNDSFGAAHRLLDMGVESYLLASSVLMVMAQRLVRVLCEACKAPSALSQSDRLFLTQEGFDAETVQTLWHAKGCSHCGHTGYSGRQSIYEAMPLTEAIKSAILRRAPSAEVRQIAMREGVITLRQAGIMKAIAGETTLEELSRVTREEH